MLATFVVDKVGCNEAIELSTNTTAHHFRVINSADGHPGTLGVSLEDLRVPRFPFLSSCFDINLDTLGLLLLILHSAIVANWLIAKTKVISFIMFHKRTRNPFEKGH